MSTVEKKEVGGGRGRMGQDGSSHKRVKTDYQSLTSEGWSMWERGRGKQYSEKNFEM